MALTGEFAKYYPRPGQNFYTPESFVLFRRTRDATGATFWWKSETEIFSYDEVFPIDLNNEQFDELVELSAIPGFITKNFQCWRTTLGNYMRENPSVMMRFRCSEKLFRDSALVDTPPMTAPFKRFA